MPLVLCLAFLWMFYLFTFVKTQALADNLDADQDYLNEEVKEHFSDEIDPSSNKSEHPSIYEVVQKLLVEREYRNWIILILSITIIVLVFFLIGCGLIGCFWKYSQSKKIPRGRPGSRIVRSQSTSARRVNTDLVFESSRVTTPTTTPSPDPYPLPGIL